MLEPPLGATVPPRALLSRLASWVRRKHLAYAALAALAVVGGALRFAHANWDEGAHLHPDERYLSIVADNVGWPGSVGEYFDVERSPLSPYNTEEGRGYLYGTLPLFGTKLVADAVGRGDYGELNLVGRRLCAALDTLTILLVFGIGLLVLAPLGEGRAQVGALLAAASYAVAVAMIQHSHFFTTDVWLVFLGTLTFWLALLSLRVGVAPGARNPAPIVLLVGIALGLTVACKLSGAFLLLPVGLALLGRAVRIRTWAGIRWSLLRLGVEAAAAVGCAYGTFRLVSPYAFASSNWLNASVNPLLRGALERQADALAGHGLLPPSYQWLLSTPVWAPLENIALWQLGLPLSLAAAGGLAALALSLVRGGRQSFRRRALPQGGGEVAASVSQLMVLAFVGGLFLSFATRFAHVGRYLLPLFPLLAVAAGYGLGQLSARFRRIGAAAAAVVLAGTTLYALAFVHIYSERNTRVAATDWLNRTLAPGTTILNEHWDDALPIGGNWSGGTTGFVGAELPVFDADDGAKLRKLYAGLSRADVYVLSSPRAWNTLGRLPDRFPLMTRFYDELLGGRLRFRRVALFESYPSLLGLELHDRRAEEAWWVYDHPPVMIFRRSGPLDWDAFRRRLCPRREPPACG